MAFCLSERHIVFSLKFHNRRESAVIIAPDTVTFQTLVTVSGRSPGCRRDAKQGCQRQCRGADEEDSRVFMSPYRYFSIQDGDGIFKNLLCPGFKTLYPGTLGYISLEAFWIGQAVPRLYADEGCVPAFG